MPRALVAYFSVTSTTEGVARRLAEAAGADLIEIVPEVPYSSQDINWNDPSSRSSVEMRDDSYRPAMVKPAANVSAYDVLFVGFPIWWYVEPRMVDAFLESCDLAGKTVVPFATSGGSGIARAVGRMRDIAPDAHVVDGRLLRPASTRQELSAWLGTLGL